MSRNKRLGSLSGALLVIVITVILLVVPGAWAQNNYKTLHKFKQGTRDGQDPSGGLVFDQSGNLYGVTFYGGAEGVGVVFKLTHQSDGSWRKDILHSFTGVDGYYPSGGLVFDAKGNLYGTTQGGGTAGAGTVFQLAPNSNGTWTESVLHSFCSLTNCSDGVSPVAGVIFDEAGNLYGTASGAGGGHGGVVFKLTPNSNGAWTESVLYTFCSLSNCTDGADPSSALIFDGAGNLYGTTQYGGRFTCPHPRGTVGCGVVFKLAPNSGGGWTETVPYTFCPLNKCYDGSAPTASLIFDQAGNLYGTTGYGGDPACNGEGVGCGVVFELTPNANGSWKEKVLHSFRGRNGAEPNDLTFGPAGDLYGNTKWGGVNGCFNGCGVVFKLTPNNGGWKETALHTFVDHSGAGPGGSLIFDANGNLYGVSGGDGNGHTFGSVFEITP